MAQDIVAKHYLSAFTDESSLERWILKALEDVYYQTKRELVEKYEAILEEKIKKFTTIKIDNKPMKQIV